MTDSPDYLYVTYPENIRPMTIPKTKTTYLTVDRILLSGTSMAAPVVSGTAVLKLQANPSLTPKAVKAILGYTAQSMTVPNILEQGNGYLNTEGAVRLAFAVSQNSNSLPAGAQWIANPASIFPYSNINGEAVLWGDAVLWDNSLIWEAQVGHSDVLGATLTRWYGLLVNPISIINSKSILAHGDEGAPPNLVVGPPGAWFYPHP